MDRNFLTRRAEQFRDDVARMLGEVSLAAPGHGQRQEKKELGLEDEITIVESDMNAQKDLCFSRPQSANEARRPKSCRFVQETMVADKVVLPVPENCPVRGLSSIAVWISDPDPSVYTQEEFDWRGTFLYLTEVHWDRVGFSTAYSGVSALQALINQITGMDFLHYVHEEFEPYGRGRDLHGR